MSHNINDVSVAAASKSMSASATTDHSDAYKASVKFIEEVTTKCDEVQGEVLAEILAQNTETEYFKRHGINGCADRETFKRKMPMITYEDIQPDIQRIYDGDFSPILCAQPISDLWLSSGTSSGQSKFMPGTDADKKRRNLMWTRVMPYIKQQIPGTNKGKSLIFLTIRDEIVTPGGIIAHPFMNSVFKNPKFYDDKPYPHNANTSPIESIHCTDHFQSIYTQLMCGFYQRLEVSKVTVSYAPTLVWVIHFLKSHYLELCNDICSGKLSCRITNAPLRSRMIETFVQKPEPGLAKFIEDTCMEENWEGIIKKIWPNAKSVEAMVSGTMAQYIPMLDYYSGGLPLVSVYYSCSESDLGYNIKPMCDPYEVSYTLLPNMAYFEFLPIKNSDSTPSESLDELVDLANVEIGQEYELVVTTYTGLYRYRVEDVLIPTGFYNSTPQFKFVRRRNVVLSVEFDKTTESELQKAIESASSVLQPFDVQVLDYTSQTDTETIPGHYIIYMELLVKNQSNELRPDIMEQCCLAMEECLGRPYRWRRAEKCIGPLEIRVVSDGTFEKLRDYAISRGASYIQYKVPRTVKLLPILELLNTRVVSTHFSSSLPHTR